MFSMMRGEFPRMSAASFARATARGGFPSRGDRQRASGARDAQRSGGFICDKTARPADWIHPRLYQIASIALSSAVCHWRIDREYDFTMILGLFPIIAATSGIEIPFESNSAAKVCLNLCMHMTIGDLAQAFQGPLPIGDRPQRLSLLPVVL